jgi:hypothetical protein
VTKAPIYQEHGFNSAIHLISEIRIAATDLKDQCPPELYNRLLTKIHMLEDACKATKNLTRGGACAGFGVDKARKEIACDGVVAIIKQIKNIKAW